MKKLIIIASLVLASVGIATVAFASTNHEKPKEEKPVCVCHLNDNEWTIINVKGDIKEGDFLYKGSKDKDVEWCKENAPVPPVVTPPVEQTVPDTQGEPADASPTALPEVGGTGRLTK